jgi:methylglyoxal synthase
MKKFTLALIAHDAKKEDMVQLVKAHKGVSR